ncbi:hypothetical protein ACWEIJ_45575 [Lentzea sp. NPDC004789]
MSRRKLTALACALLAAGTMAVSGAGAASASPVGVQGLPTFFGVKTLDEGGNGQCTNAPNGMWAVNPGPTNPVRLDTDNRPGGCLLSFGIGDIDGSLAGLDITYQLLPSYDSQAGQCGTNWGVNHIPIGPSFSFGPDVRVDTDNRPGWCELTFASSGRNDVVLGVLFTAENDTGQCVNTGSNDWQSVPPGGRLTLNIDTDHRPGGCGLQLRLTKY